MATPVLGRADLGASLERNDELTDMKETGSRGASRLLPPLSIEGVGRWAPNVERLLDAGAVFQQVHVFVS